nr:immunoglobulin heavy chain junction region [Macaca mulatta]
CAREAYSGTYYYGNSLDVW